MASELEKIHFRESVQNVSELLQNSDSTITQKIFTEVAMWHFSCIKMFSLVAQSHVMYCYIGKHCLKKNVGKLYFHFNLILALVLIDSF